MTANRFHIFDLSIKEDDAEQKTLEILKTVRPDWPGDKVTFKVGDLISSHPLQELCY